MVESDGVNVRVAVRARPLNGREKKLGCEECVEMNGGTTVLKDENGKTKEFNFDFSYWYNTPQKIVYDDLAKPIVEAAIDGFNGVIFAYGQTGSGKTHSMMGTGDDVGIVPLMNQELFEMLNRKKDSSGVEYMVTASYMEIYNEIIRDLLNPSDKHLKIREHPKSGIYVEHLAELVVENAEGIAKLLEQGNNVKQVAATQMNDRSSRSHCCFVVSIQQRKLEELGEGDEAVKRETTLSAKINLVDLAGSERASKTGAEGARLKEGAAINLSLSTLGQVINMLAEGSVGHIPYRNSKLTRVLQQALGGNAKTVMIATISPADNNYQETLSTLQYASRAKKIKNTTIRNEDVNQRLIRELREELDRLRAEMAAIQTVGPVDQRDSSNNLEEEGDPKQVQQMQETIAMLEEAKKVQWEEVQKLSKAYEEERNRTLKNENVVRSIMQNVKEERMALMKELQELELEKTLLSKSLRQSKTDYTETKTSLEKDMERYKQLMSIPEEERDEKAIEEIFHRIEANRNTLVKQRDQMKELKEKLRVNQEQQIEQRAEIEAQQVVLQGDEELRRAIKEEEMSKLVNELNDKREELINKELENERAKMESLVTQQVRTMESNYKRKLTAAQSRQLSMDDKVYRLEMGHIDLKCDNDHLRAEVSRLRQVISQMERDHEKIVADLQGEHAQTVRRLVAAFKQDQAKLLHALQIASSDAVALSRQLSLLDG